MKTTIEIQSMSTGETTIKTFINNAEAYTYFANFCDEHGYDYDYATCDAGGIGCDYRITIM